MATNAKTTAPAPAVEWPLPRIEVGMKVRVDYSHPEASHYSDQRWSGRIGTVTRENPCGRPMKDGRGATSGGLWYVRLAPTSRSAAHEICICGAALVPHFELGQRVKANPAHPLATELFGTVMGSIRGTIFSFDPQFNGRYVVELDGEVTIDDTRLPRIPAALLTPILPNEEGFWPEDDEDPNLTYDLVVEHGLILEASGKFSRYALGADLTRIVWVNDKAETIADPEDEDAGEEGDDE